MNAQKIIEWIKAPASINEEDTAQLKEIVKDFPVSSIVQWLYLKGLQNQESYLYTSQLSRTAIGSTDRSKLQSWVGLSAEDNEGDKRFNFKLPQERKPEPIVEQPKEVEVLKEPEPIKIKAEIPEPAPIEKKLEEAEKPIVAPAVVNEKELPDDIKAILERSKKIRKNYLKTQEDEKAEQLGAVQNDAPVKVEEPEEKPEEPVVQVEETPEVVEKIEMPVEVTEVEKPTIQEPKLEPEPEQELEQEKLPEIEYSIALDLDLKEEEEVDFAQSSFSEWLKSKTDLKNEIKEEELPNIETLEEDGFEEMAPIVLEIEGEEEEVEEEELLPVVEEIEKSVALNPKKKKTIELVDKFLERKPRIRPNPNMPVLNSPILLSVSESPEFITQTLAQIYINQGHLEKAIEAYEILRLKYPEKSGFFTDQIREIKSLKK